MHPAFKNRVWQLSVAPPWQAEDCEHCVELTRPGGVGAMHISCARKIEGLVTTAEALAYLRDGCPDEADSEEVVCGDFAGYTAEYVDGKDNAFWKKWFVFCRKDLLFITYTCDHGTEDLELKQASNLLNSLRSKA